MNTHFMKFKTLILLGLLMTACGRSSDDSSIPILRFDGYKGNIAKIEESFYHAVEKFGDIYPDDQMNLFVYEYDNEGFQIGYSVYYRGECDFKVVNVFENGRCVKSMSHQKYNDIDRESRFVKHAAAYDQWIMIEKGDTTFYRSYTNGLHETLKTDDGQLLNEGTFDETGHILDQKSYTDGVISFRRLAEYDQQGFVSKTTEYHGDGKEPEISTYVNKEYDSKGNPTTVHIYEGDKVNYVVQRIITYR